MGSLLSLLSLQSYEEVDLDFNGNPRPAADDEKVHARMSDLLSSAARNLQLIEGYTGCQELARQAMSNPSHENEKAAFEGLLSCVDSIASFFSFCKDMESVLPELLMAISRPPPTEDKNANVIADRMALALQIAQVFQFSLEFDRIRMLRPNLSNDFSYYRRLLPKFNKHPDIRVNEDEASGMALFTAEHIPMLNCLAKAANRAQEKSPYVGQVLAVLANSCNKALKTKKFGGDSVLTLLVARCMTSAIVVFDHIDALSVFHKKSPISVKNCVLTLKKELPAEFSLLNAIHYSTKHFSEAPQSIQDLFD